MIYGLSLRTILKHKRRLSQMPTKKDEWQKKKENLVSALTLGSVLSLTWIFGFFYMFNGKTFNKKKLSISKTKFLL